MKDYFISYNKADKAWAEWVAWTLEENGYSVIIQAWDFRPGGNFVLEMQEAATRTEKTIAILSENYLAAEYTQPEWAAAFKQDPKGERRTLIPIRVDDCAPTGLLAQISYIDLVGLSEAEARKAILEGLKDRAKPDEAPAFPINKEQIINSTTDRVVQHSVPYPGVSKNEAQNSEVISNLPQGIQFFTGREDILDQIHKSLAASGLTALSQRQAISGLGGIGKTQTAIAYAQRRGSEYKAVLWTVAESRESLISGFVSLAHVLNLIEKNIQDQNVVVTAVKRWLEGNDDWLLILDNADEPKIIEEFLPSSYKGHVLLTSRAQVFDSIGILNPTEMEEMSPQDAKEFLLKRTGRENLDANELEAIEALAGELDYLPLALEQAGAYIKELRSSFQDYLASYRKRGLELLEKGSTGSQYRKSVRTTWSLNFQQVEQTSKAGADLLRASAFLNPDKIPNELIGRGAAHLGPNLSAALADVEADPLLLDEVLKPLIQYSLIHRDRNLKAYDIHRLVQSVLKDRMDEATKRSWAERIVNALASVFPDIDMINYQDWERVDRLLPHAQACAELIEVWELESPQAAKLLNDTGRYLHLRARLREAEALYARSLAIRTKLYEPDHPDIATSLYNRAWLYRDQGKYRDAEPLYRQSLEIRKATLDANHPDLATGFQGMGDIYIRLGNLADAKSLLQTSIEIRENIFGKNHHKVAESILSLVFVYREEADYAEAEALLLRSIDIMKSLGPEDPKMAGHLSELGTLYYLYNNYIEAERLYLQALLIEEKAYGPNYPHVADTLRDLGIIYRERGEITKAESLLQRSLQIRETVLGSEHPDVAETLISLAILYLSQNKYAEAEGFLTRALNVNEQSYGPDHYRVAYALQHLANLYYEQRKPVKGEMLVRRAISIYRKQLGPEHPRTAEAMLDHAFILKAMNRKGEAQRLEAQANKILSKRRKKSKK